MCGVTTTFGIPQNGCSVGSGSSEKTSRTAPAIQRSWRARTRAGSWMSEPRPRFTSQDSGRIAWSSGSPSIPRVSGVSGATRTT